ncbi:MAG: phage tail tape measure protein, partial [Oscillospiraceae bacterium]|nr:phage tail tape measure protein [Oscillospiraceae bacterium]
MADRIKGITVQIGGDTTGLSKALSGVNKELSSTESQLKDVERLLKLDPGNTKLMEQKQRLLAEAVGETKSKLDTLKEAEKQVQQQFAEGKVSQQQYEGLQREISATQTKLETLEAQARQTGSVAAQQLDHVGGKLQAFGGTMSAAGTALLPVTAAVTAAGTAAVTTTAAFDEQMSAVRSISGATGESFDRLREKALEMGAKTAFSATEAAQALEYMAAAGWSTEDMLAGIEGVMAAAAASGEDLALTSDILTDGLTAFGMGAEDADRFANVLVAAGNASNTSVAMMGETFQYAGSVCGALGISLEDASVAAGLMANSGIKASQAGTTLRAGLTNLVKPTKAMKAAMEAYNISIHTTEDGSVDLMATMESLRSGLGGLDETTRAAALASIFGKDAMSGWAAVVTATDEDFRTLTEAIYGCSGAAAAASEVRLDNL